MAAKIIVLFITFCVVVACAPQEEQAASSGALQADPVGEAMAARMAALRDEAVALVVDVQIAAGVGDRRSVCRSVTRAIDLLDAMDSLGRAATHRLPRASAERKKIEEALERNPSLRAELINAGETWCTLRR